MTGVSWDRPGGEWQVAAFFGRIVCEGLCSYPEILAGRLPFSRIFDMHRMLDYRERRRFDLMKKWKAHNGGNG